MLIYAIFLLIVLKKLVSNLFDKESMCSLWKVETLLDTGLKLKTIHCVLEFIWSQWLKPYRIQQTKKNRNKKKIMEKMEMRCTH